MLWVQRLWLRLQTLFSRRRAVEQLDDEIQFHLDQQISEYVAAGMDREEARHAAMRVFGNRTLLKEKTREAWGWGALDQVVQDLRYGFRGMRRDAGTTVLAILIAGVGIGSASTVFSVVNALLLRPLPFRDPGRLVWISNGENYSTQPEQYSDLREQNQSFSDLAGWAGFYRAGDKKLTGIGEPERLTSVPVTENFFSLLGVEPFIGRSFTSEECQGKFYAPPAMLLSHNFWRRRFASDPNVVGQKLVLDNQSVVIVGVLPASFDFASVLAPGTPVDIFIPWPLKDTSKPAGNTMAIVGRLKPGANRRKCAGRVHRVGETTGEPVSGTESDQAKAGSAGTARERTSASRSRGADVRSGCGDVDCLRESFASANGANGDAAKGNGDTISVRSWAFSVDETDANRERNSLVLWCCVGPPSRRGRHARSSASRCIEPSSSGKRSTRWEHACLHLAGGGRFGRALWLGAGAAGSGVQAP